MKLDDLLKQEAAGQSAMSYANAQERYAQLGVDTEDAIQRAVATPVSAHCWQADDVVGLEVHEGATDSGGLAATGNYPGRARTGDEIRADFETAVGLIPGLLRFNLHAMYAETGGKSVDRDELQPEHFATWIDWCDDRGWGMDFNPTCFAHPKASDGLTLAHPRKSIRDFWVRHCIACREIGGAIGKRLGPCVVNIWVPDGQKDATADLIGSRKLLLKSLDGVLEKRVPKVIDTVESKLFGIGVEDSTVGSHEFYLLYAASRGCGLCFDMGHYHPTENIADKVSAALLFLKPLLIHASRGVRWDSDHVTRFNDDLRAVADAVIRSGMTQHVYWATDFFDASINRVAAWVIGLRSVRKALLWALLEPHAPAVEAERAGDGTAKLALAELRAELPFAAVWQEICRRADVPTGLAWLDEVRRYEQQVLSARD